MSKSIISIMGVQLTISPKHNSKLMGKSESKSSSVSTSVSHSSLSVARGAKKLWQRITFKKDQQPIIVDFSWSDIYYKKRVTKVQLLMRPLTARDGYILTTMKIQVGFAVGASASLAIPPPIGQVVYGVGAIGAFAAQGLGDFLHETLMHHALYLEVEGGTFKIMFDFNQDTGLDFTTELQAILPALKEYEKQGCHIIDIDFAETLTWEDMIAAVKEVSNKRYDALTWNCQDHTAHLIKRAKKQ